ncbi:MAG: tetratricopeptide repeat protein [Maricaulaceae bacterium]|jgi:tetratricopeptide (TPR) repeat protein
MGHRVYGLKFDRFARRLVRASAASACLAVLASGTALAQTCPPDEEDDAASRVFTPEVGEIVQAAQEKMTLEDYPGALADFQRALTQEEPSRYELGVILYMAGGARYQTDDVPGAMRDWERALREGDLRQAECLNVMYNMAQLHLQNENYRTAIDMMEEWIALGGDANDGVHLNLVVAYSEIGDLRSALRHGLLAYQKANPRLKRHYDVLNYLYDELNMPAERAELLTEMVALFPQERSVWASIAALHAQAGRERKAFEINKIMYLNGMMTREREIMQVVDYYSYYDVPYRGARILEAEINAGRVERDQENLEKLARLYRQANEFDRAIPSLEAAARMSPDGELYRTLGEAYYAEAQLPQAEAALENALNRGGLEDAGDVWVVLGNARYEQEDYQGAIEAFVEAQRFQGARQTARDWQEFVESEIATARNSAWFEVEVEMGRYRVQCERALSDIVIYRGQVESGEWTGPDCVEVVNREDFSSVSEVVVKIGEFCSEFEDAPQCTGRPELALFETMTDEAVDGEDAGEQDEASAAEDAEPVEEADASDGEANASEASAGDD